MLRPRCAASVLAMLGLLGVALAPGQSVADQEASQPTITSTAGNESTAFSGESDVPTLSCGCCSSGCSKGCCPSGCSKGCGTKGCGGNRACCPYQDNCFFSRRCKKKGCGPRRIQYVIVDGGQAAIGSMCNWRTESSFQPGSDESDVFVDWTVRRDVYPRSSAPPPMPMNDGLQTHDAMLAGPAEIVPAQPGTASTIEPNKFSATATSTLETDSKPIEARNHFRPAKPFAPAPGGISNGPRPRVTTKPINVRTIQGKPRANSERTPAKSRELSFPKATSPKDDKGPVFVPKISWSHNKQGRSDHQHADTVRSIKMLTVEERLVKKDKAEKAGAKGNDTSSALFKKVAKRTTSKGSSEQLPQVTMHNDFSSQLSSRTANDTKKKTGSRRSGFRKMFGRLFRPGEERALYVEASGTDTPAKGVKPTNYSFKVGNDPSVNRAAGASNTVNAVSMQPASSRATEVDPVTDAFQSKSDSNVDQTWSTTIRGWEND